MMRQGYGLKVVWPWNDCGKTMVCRDQIQVWRVTKKVKNGEWGYRWGYKVGLHFRKTGVTKLLPTHTVWGGGNEPKNGVKCRKLTLFVQLFRGRYLAQSLINRGFSGFWRLVWVGGTPLIGYRGYYRRYSLPFLMTRTTLHLQCRNSGHDQHCPPYGVQVPRSVLLADLFPPPVPSLYL